MIATATLAGSSLPAEVSFSRSGRRKMASSVLDDSGARSARGRLQKRFSPLRARISGAKSAALFDPLRAK